MPNLRRNARGRPHRLHRLCCRDENFGLRLSLTLFAVVAIDSSLVLSPKLGCLPEWDAEVLQQRPGMLIVFGRRHNGDVHALQLVDA